MGEGFGVLLLALIAAYAGFRSIAPQEAGSIEDAVKDKALDIIAGFEGFSSGVYLDQTGKWTIGFGHLVQPGDVYYPYGAVKTISRDDAEQLLAKDTATAQVCIDSHVVVPLNGNQRQALISFVFNVGCGNFTRSTLLQKLNQGDYDGAAAEFSRWVYGGGRIIAGLVSRRGQEAGLFNG